MGLLSFQHDSDYDYCLNRVAINTGSTSLHKSEATCHLCDKVRHILSFVAETIVKKVGDEGFLYSLPLSVNDYPLLSATFNIDVYFYH